MGGKKMIYSAKVLEIHENICSVEAETEAEARQKFLSGSIPYDDYLGSEHVSTVAVVQIKENPDHDADFDPVDPEKCMKILNFNLEEEEFIILMYCLNEKLAEHEHYLQDCTISHQGQKAQRNYISTITSIRNKFLKAKDKLIGSD
jgi:hypothetical protein